MIMRDGYIERDAEGKPVALHLSATTYDPPKRFKRGDRVIAFAHWEWQPVGDIGDNSCFWHPATVLHYYWRDGDWLVDLLFDGGRVSRGHFAYGLKPEQSAGSGDNSETSAQAGVSS